MRARISKGTVAAAAAAAVAALAVPGIAVADRDDDGPKAIGLTGDGQKLVSFSLDAPKNARKLGTIKGLTVDTALIGIDYRVQDDRLYGVGNKGGIYKLSLRKMTAYRDSQLTVDLAGTFFGVDFNPAANRLRIISDAGQNLRHDLANDTTVTDTPLNYPAVTPGLGVTAAAYTNNDENDGTFTTLFDIDTTLGQVAIQSPANSGTLTGTGVLGVEAGKDAGFDIYSDLSDGKTKSVKGYATLWVGGKTRLYSVNLFTGTVSKIGTFRQSVTDIAVQLDD